MGLFPILIFNITRECAGVKGDFIMSLTENGSGMYMPVAPAYGNNGGFGGFGFGGDGARPLLV